MKNEFIIRQAEEKDAPLLRHLAKNCPPLDVHTQYTYWVVASFYGEYSFFVYEKNGDSPVGYVMCVKTNDTLFFWQIGVRKEYRGRGLSRLLIDAVFKKAESETESPILGVTIAKDNQNSYFAFLSLLHHNLRRVRGPCHHPEG